MLLAIDTSTSQASIALVRTPEPTVGDAGDTAERAPTEAANLLAELTWDVGLRHSAELFPRLRWLLSATSTTPADMDGIAVALGPGSFNGVRVALATAKSLAFALSLPIIGVPTLDVVAWGAHLAEGPLWALLEAGRGQVYAASYPGWGVPAGAWAPHGERSVLTPDEVAEYAARELANRGGSGGHRVVTFCGEWREATRQAITEALAARGFGARFAETLGGRRASWLAALALARAARGQYDDAMSIEPLYLRRPAITQPGPKRQAQQPTRDPRRDSEQASEHGAAEADGGSRAPRRRHPRTGGSRHAPEATDGEESSHALRS